MSLNELTEKDKFFLIQQIEDLNKNIRYCQESDAIFEDEDDENLISDSAVAGIEL